jgi:Zn-finger nucleic acid-binding protein
MRIACKDCHRQYDVRHLEIGAKVRCTCGELLEVKRVEARDAPMLRCSTCGAQLQEGAKECSFCGSELQLGDKGWGETCPECFARLVAGAKFCSSCGTEMRDEAVLQPLHDTECPRCQGRMSVREQAKGSITECSSCGGIWLPEEQFERVTQQAGSEPLPAGSASSSPGSKANQKPEPVRYLKCPICSQLMHRKNYASMSGLIIDWCRGHGFWFDQGRDREHPGVRPRRRPRSRPRSRGRA